LAGFIRGSALSGRARSAPSAGTLKSRVNCRAFALAIIRVSSFLRLVRFGARRCARPCARFSTILLQPGLPKAVACPRYHRIWTACCERCPALDEHRNWNHLNAIHGARSDAQLATRTSIEQNRVHAFSAPDDRIDRAGLDAERAADAPFLIDQCRGKRFLDAVGGIERQGLAPEQRGEPVDPSFASRRTLVNLGLTAGDRFGVGTASAVAALRALRLREQVVNLVGERHY